MSIVSLAASANLAPFKLDLEAVPSEVYSVLRWRMDSKLDEPYCATVVLHVQRAFMGLFGRLATKRVAGQRATFSLQAQAHTFEPLHGRIDRCALGADDLDPVNPFGAGLGGDVVSVTLNLRPRLWWASKAQQSRSFQRLTASEVVMQVLAEHRLTAQDVEFRLTTPLRSRRYRQQFQETNLAFVFRTLEREGLMYFFEQGADREVMVVTDDASGYTRPRQWSAVRVVPEGGMATPVDDGLFLSGWNQVVTSFEVRRGLTTTEHSVDDYNYRNASRGVDAERAGVDEATGEERTYGSHAKMPEEAILRVRQQQERAAQHALRGTATSTLTALAPGQCIGVLDANPARHNLTGRWLVLSVQSSGDREHPYVNRFDFQPEMVPYRPEWDTPLPEMAGFTHMRTDTTNTGNPYARLDQHGRYLAWHHFEHSTSQGGMGSAPIRMVRDYAGPTYGQHFPVHAGVEALAGYLHGDPDRPVLLGVVHDSRNPNHVTALNPSRHVLRTWANNKLRMEDEAGREHVKLATEYGLSQLNLGHLVNQEKKSRGEGFELRTDHEGAIRAERGLLMTTVGTDANADPTAEGHQLHLDPLQQQIEGIRPWADNRSKAATQVGLEETTSLKAANRFKDDLPGLKSPIQASYSDAGLIFTAARNLSFGAEQTQGFYAMGPISLTCQLPFGITAKKGMRFHAENGGVRHVTSNGDHTIHVQDGDWTVLASGLIRFESKSGVVRLQTKDGKYFVEAGPNGFRSNAKELINLAGVLIDMTGGPFNGKASADAGYAQGLDYFGKMNVKDKTFDDKFTVFDRAGKGVAGVRYTMRNTLTGETNEGTTNAAGKMPQVVDGAPEYIHVVLKQDRPS